MLLRIHRLSQLSFSDLMAVYAEGNKENAADFWPDLPPQLGILRAEQDFYTYLRDVFFQTPGALYCVWQEHGRYVSALRLEPYKDGWLLEALETEPGCRRCGFAHNLIHAVQQLPEYGKLYSHVHKGNGASLAVHEKCGFRRISESAAYIDGSVNSRACTMCWEK